MTTSCAQHKLLKQEAKSWLNRRRNGGFLYFCLLTFAAVVAAWQTSPRPTFAGEKRLYYEASICATAYSPPIVSFLIRITILETEEGDRDATFHREAFLVGKCIVPRSVRDAEAKVDIDLSVVPAVLGGPFQITHPQFQRVGSRPEIFLRPTGELNLFKLSGTAGEKGIDVLGIQENAWARLRTITTEGNRGILVSNPRFALQDERIQGAEDHNVILYNLATDRQCAWSHRPDLRDDMRTCTSIKKSRWCLTDDGQTAYVVPWFDLTEMFTLGQHTFERGKHFLKLEADSSGVVAIKRPTKDVGNMHLAFDEADGTRVLVFSREIDERPWIAVLENGKVLGQSQWIHPIFGTPTGDLFPDSAALLLIAAQSVPTRPENPIVAGRYGKFRCEFVVWDYRNNQSIWCHADCGSRFTIDTSGTVILHPAKPKKKDKGT